MTTIRRITSLLFVLLLALNAMPTAAQGIEALDDPSELDGIQFAITRTWSVDVDLVDFESGELPGVMALAGAIFQFDTRGHAQDAFAIFNDIDDSEYIEEFGVDEGSVTRTVVKNLGDEAFGFDIALSMDGMDVSGRFILIRDGKYLIMVATMGFDKEAAVVADEFADAILGNLKRQKGIGEYDEDTGMYSGGLWDIFPPADDPILTELIHEGDEVLYPD